MIPATIATPGPPSASAASPSSMSPAATSPWPMKTAPTSSSSTARSSITPACAPPSNRPATATPPAPTPRPSSTPTSNTAPIASCACAACSPSPSGIRTPRKLFCARDRLGKKPFYYYWDGRTFAFASEIKALLEHPSISPQFEESLLPEYLAFGYISDDRTLFRGIRKLMPGHHLTLDLSAASPQPADPPILGHPRSPARDARATPPGSPSAATAWNRPSACV